MIAGVRVLRLPVAARLSRARGPHALAAGPALERDPALRRRAAALSDPGNFPIALYGKLLGRRVVFTHHGDLVMPAGAFNRVVERIVTALMVRALAMASRITVHSCDYARHSTFLSPFSEKLDCIYPPAALPVPDPIAISRWKTELALTGRPLVGFAGRWVEEKGFDILLEAIPHVLREIPEAQFLYAGAKPDYEDFRSRCEPLLEPVRDRVTMLGLLTDPQKLADFYGMCDLFALPSRTDCFPSTQIEAILCGTPLVSADIPGAREVVEVTGMGCASRPGIRSPWRAGSSRFCETATPGCGLRPTCRATLQRWKMAEYEELLSRLAIPGAAAA